MYSRFVVESPLNPQEAVDFRSSASYSHRDSLVVHEVSFPVYHSLTTMVDRPIINLFIITIGECNAYASIS